MKKPAGGRLCVFNYNGLDDIGGIFAFIGDDLHHLVDIPFFDDFLCIGFGLKKPLDYSVFSASAGALLLAVFPDHGA